MLEALRAGKEIDKIVLRQRLEGLFVREIMDEARKRNISCQFVPAERLDKIARGGAHQGVAALLSQIDYADFEGAVDKALATSASPVILLLDGVSDVRNLGAIARTAECAGVSAIVVPAKGGAAINAEAVKSSAGALLRIDTCRVPNLKMAIYYLKQSGFTIVAATEKADGYIYDVDFRGPVAVIMGSEDRGISPANLALADCAAKIPMVGEISSLNVSVATSIVLFEIVRQRLK